MLLQHNNDTSFDCFIAVITLLVFGSKFKLMGRVAEFCCSLGMFSISPPKFEAMPPKIGAAPPKIGAIP